MAKDGFILWRRWRRLYTATPITQMKRHTSTMIAQTQSARALVSMAAENSASKSMTMEGSRVGIKDGDDDGSWVGLTVGLVVGLVVGE